MGQVAVVLLLIGIMSMAVAGPLVARQKDSDPRHAWTFTGTFIAAALLFLTALFVPLPLNFVQLPLVLGFVFLIFGFRAMGGHLNNV